MKKDIRLISKVRKLYPDLIDLISSSDTIALLEILNYHFQYSDGMPIDSGCRYYDALLFLGGDSAFLFTRRCDKLNLDTIEGSFNVEIISLNENVRIKDLTLRCYNYVMIDPIGWTQKHLYREYNGYFTGNGLMSLKVGKKVNSYRVNIDPCF